MTGLGELPSAGSWAFPPNPETHHVRWVEPDPAQPGRVYVAIEAGALLRTPDDGRTWVDRVPGGPYDTHTAAAHPVEKGFIASSAGDGYYESHDGGETWTRPMAGLGHRYLVGLAVHPRDHRTVIVSAASSPRAAYTPQTAASYVYRKTPEGEGFTLAMEGLPPAKGTTVTRFAWDPDSPEVLYGANNRGLYRSENAGVSWQRLEIPWPERPFSRGARALGVLGGEAR
jgi:hypothetical protein